jgi:hypothetical protein
MLEKAKVISESLQLLYRVVTSDVSKKVIAT